MSGSSIETISLAAYESEMQRNERENLNYYWLFYSNDKKTH